MGTQSPLSQAAPSLPPLQPPRPPLLCSARQPRLSTHTHSSLISEPVAGWALLYMTVIGLNSRLGREDEEAQ